MEQKLVLILLIKRILWACFLSLFGSFLCFVLIFYSKGSVAHAMSLAPVNTELVSQIESNLNLDKPLFIQYKSWLTHFLQADFGISFVSGEKVSVILMQTLPLTLILGLGAFFVLSVLSIVLAMLCVYYKDSFFDKFLHFISMSFLALPSFALSLLAILLFSVELKILPSSGALTFEGNFSFKNLILPLSVLVLTHLAIYLRFSREAFLESLNQNYIQNAFARGLSKKRIYWHLVLKDAMPSIVSYFGSCIVSFLGTTYVVESVFSYGGLGQLALKSILFKDYPVVLAVIVISICLAVFITLCCELIIKSIYTRLDNA
ncbi:ABC transporter permease [Campylobacter sp. CCS1377]|uniref:ABC transporter permease n=1 Tax=Campylobacter sp. CCS1377 TaxID=3158229 RepID=A0AAU7E896_9BACT|nr:ABC transporter permease [Campylobacter jejuni]